MEKLNLVPCKRCSRNFNYVQNVSGNARQLCNECRIIVDNEDLEDLKEKTIKEGNRYLVGSPGRKDEYDPVDILINGEIPDFNSDAEKFICAVEVGKFIRNNGMNCMEDNLIKLFDSLDTVHWIICVKQLSFEQNLSLSKNKKFEKYIKNCMKLI
jgi:hypothetical protein